MSARRGLHAWLVAAALLAGEGGAAAQPTPLTASAPPRLAPAPEKSTADVVEAARKHFQRGVELTASGKLKEALDEFQTAYDLSPTYRILYNIGRVSRHLGDHPRSLRAFEQYLADGGEEIDRLDRKRRAEVNAEIASLRGLVGTVRVRVEPEGAAVFLDGARIGEAPLTAPLYVQPGPHRLRAERAGRAPAAEAIEIAGGQTIEVGLRLGPAPVASQPDPKPLPPPPQRGAPTWIGWVATGALAAGAGVAGALALVSSNDLEDTRYAGPGRRPPPDSDVSSLQSRVDALAIVTDVLAGAAVISLGVTLYFTLTEPPPGGSVQAHRFDVRVGARGASIQATF